VRRRKHKNVPAKDKEVVMNVAFKNPSKPRKSRSQIPDFTQASGGIAAPVSISYPLKVGKKSISHLKNGSIVVNNTEYFTDALASVAFSVVGYNINPGLSTMFPWLSTIASCYEEYRFRKLVIKYRAGGPTNNAGKVYLATDMDALDPLPTTKAAMLANYNYKDCPVWGNVDLHVVAGLNQFKGNKYIRQGPVANSDLKTYDTGLLLVGANGAATSFTCGDLLVEYEVEFHIPQSKGTGTGVTTVQTWRNPTGRTDTPFNPTGVYNIGTVAEILNSGIKFLSVGTYWVSHWAQLLNTTAGTQNQWYLQFPSVGAYSGYNVREKHDTPANWRSGDFVNTPSYSTNHMLVDILQAGTTIPITGAGAVAQISPTISQELRISPFSPNPSYT